MREIHPQFDPEVIAALIDGRLAGEAREQAIQQLAESEAAFEAFAETLRARAEEETGRSAVAEPAAAAPVVPLRPRWARAARPLAVAAVLLLLLGGPAAVFLIQRDAGPAPAGRLLAPVIERNPVLAQGWSERAWTVTRGGPSRLVEPSLAFRLGVRTVDLHLALALGDTGQAQVFLGEMAGWLAEVELSQLVQARYARLREQLASGGSTDALALAAEAERSLEELLDSPSFRLGRWTEAALLAARQGVPDPFESGRAVRFLERQAAEHSGATAEALRQIAELIRDGVDQSEYPELERQLFDVIAANAG